MKTIKLQTRSTLKPSPPSLLGGEGWVRGQRVGLLRGAVIAQRSPVTPTLSPDDEAVEGEGGER
jgi:hypothetical protein